MTTTDSPLNHRRWHHAHVLGALALEFAPDSACGRDVLPQSEAGTLAALLARDLATHDAHAATLACVTVGAHYDPVELLRPGWPLHRELDQLAARAPHAAMSAGTGRIIAFGSHDGRLPGGLAPSPEFRGGPLRLLPFVLSVSRRIGGDPDSVARVGATFESTLMERGMAAADTALAMQSAFGLRVEHARYLTLHDLCALTAMQYEHAGLAPLWPILETALLSPEREAWLDAPPEPLLHYAQHEVRIALFSADGWRRRHAGGETDGARLQRAFAQFEARARQFASVLQAHGVAVTFTQCGAEPRKDL